MKVLIISHNPISTYQNMGKTMKILFSSFQKSEICQLYIYPSVPELDCCSSYYRVTDKDVLHSFLSLKVNGHEIQPNFEQQNMFSNAEDEQLYRSKKNKKPIRMLARDAMWQFSHWYNSSLKSWLEAEKPTCIFLAPGSAKFIYRIAFKIAKKYKLPIATYICDEYYFLPSGKSFLEKIWQRSLAKSISSLMQKTSHVITICDELKECYTSYFGVRATTIMTGSSFPAACEAKLTLPTALTYMGNIRYNRYRSLVDIGRALDAINAEHDSQFELHIYSSERDAEILSVLGEVPSIKLCGYVSGNEYERAFRSAEILVHTEAFDEENIEKVKHSISTKIADSLSSGICLFAYGPSKVASMQHLIRNKCAVTALEQSELKDKLYDMLTNEKVRNTVVNNALKVAKMYHDQDENSRRLYEVISSFN